MLSLLKQGEGGIGEERPTQLSLVFPHFSQPSHKNNDVCCAAALNNAVGVDGGFQKGRLGCFLEPITATAVFSGPSSRAMELVRRPSRRFFPPKSSILSDTHIHITERCLPAWYALSKVERIPILPLLFRVVKDIQHLDKVQTRPQCPE